MHRRNFIKGTSALGIAGIIGLTSCGSCKDAEILILGGGISGLYLAYLLDQADREYVLLEGSSRLGGRLFTHEGLQNREVGGRGIGDKYAEVMKLVEEFDIDLLDITENMRSPTAIYLNGILHNEWISDSPNPRLLEFQLSEPLPSLGGLDEWYQLPELDKKYSQLLRDSGRTEEEIDLINISANYNDVRNTSAINSLHSAAFRRFNGSRKIYNFKNGSKTFIDAISNSLKGQVLLNKMVTQISDSDDCVTVTCEDGKTLCASKAVSTLPFSTLRDVEMDITLSRNQSKLIRELDYTKITQIHLHPNEPFWEEDGYHIDMWTDTAIERVMNVSEKKDEVKLACWVNGNGTSFFDEKSDSEIEEYVMNTFKKIRPASEGKLEYIGTHNWGQYRFNKGAYAEFKVGQAQLFEDAINPAGNLHFAGEHTAKMSRGIEGAAESAVRVFNELTS